MKNMNLFNTKITYASSENIKSSVVLTADNNDSIVIWYYCKNIKKLAFIR